MTDLLANAFKRNDKNLIPFITCGDPDLDYTYNLVLEMEKNGATIIELGVPYSDPVADGDIIQNSYFRALKNNINLSHCIELVKRLRLVTQIPIVFLTYFNPVFKYGFVPFVIDCLEAGVNGVIVPDMPLEERLVMQNIIGHRPFHVIQLVAPTSENRIESLVKDASGFIYCVSSLGVTGKRSTFNYDLKELVQTIKKYSNTPVAIGFGVSSRQTVSELSPICDGVIVGSAIVERIATDEAADFVGELVQGL